MKWYGTGVGTNETVWYLKNTGNDNLLHYYLINFLLNSHLRFKILVNQNNSFSVVSIIMSTFKE